MKLSLFATALTTATALTIPDFGISNVLSNQQNPVAAAERYLIQLSPDETRWVTEGEKWATRREGRNFFDITDRVDEFGLLKRDDVDTEKKNKTKVTFPEKTAQNKSITPLLKKLDKDRMRKDLEKFSGFHTRYYKSDYGKKSSEWLLSQINDTLSEAGVGIVQPFPHEWVQSSINSRRRGCAGTEHSHIAEGFHRADDLGCGVAVQFAIGDFAEYKNSHYKTPASFRFDTSSSTLPTMMPALRPCGSRVDTISNRGLTSTPRSAGVFSSSGFFLAFMMLGSEA